MNVRTWWLRLLSFTSLCGDIFRQRAALGSFYEYVAPDVCSPAVPLSRPVPLVAGSLGLPGERGDSGPATLARLRLPRALALDEDARLLYVADAGNHAVRRVDLAYPNLIRTVVGVLGSPGMSGEEGGPALSAKLREPRGLALDVDPAYSALLAANASRDLNGTASASAGTAPLRGQLYIADGGNHAVRALDLASGTLSTVAGVLGIPGDAAERLRYPSGLALDRATQRLFVADAGNGRVCVLELVSATGRQCEPLHVGLSHASAAGLLMPIGLALDVAREGLFIADYGAHLVLRVDHIGNLSSLGNFTGDATVVAGAVGQGPGSLGDGATLFDAAIGDALEAKLKNPVGLALDSLAQRLYIADSANPAVRVVDLESGQLAVAVGRPGYYQHGLSEDDVGPVGLALGSAEVVGITVLHVVREPPQGGPDIHGMYFYFAADDYPGISGEGKVWARHYRRGVLLWVGEIFFYDFRNWASPRPFDCIACTATGVRYPFQGTDAAAREGQFEIGDVVLIPSVHGSSPSGGASQQLYMAEGNNFVVRRTNLAQPMPPICPSDPDLAAHVNR